MRLARLFLILAVASLGVASCNRESPVSTEPKPDKPEAFDPQKFADAQNRAKEIAKTVWYVDIAFTPSMPSEKDGNYYMELSICSKPPDSCTVRDGSVDLEVASPHTSWEQFRLLESGHRVAFRYRDAGPDTTTVPYPLLYNEAYFLEPVSPPFTPAEARREARRIAREPLWKVAGFAEADDGILSLSLWVPNVGESVLLHRITNVHPAYQEFQKLKALAEEPYESKKGVVLHYRVGVNPRGELASNPVYYLEPEGFR